MDFQTGGGGGGTLKKLGKNKMFLIAAAGVAVIGLIVMLKRGSSTATEEGTMTTTADGYPSPYNGVDTAAQMQNMQSILEGQIEANNNAMYSGMMSELNETKADMKEEYDAKLAEKEAAISKAANDKISALTKTNAVVQTDSLGNQKWKANYVYKTLLSNGASSASVKKNSSGNYYVTANFNNSAKADAAAQNAIKQTSVDKRIGFKNYSKTEVK